MHVYPIYTGIYIHIYICHCMCIYACVRGLLYSTLTWDSETLQTFFGCSENEQ